MRHLNPSLEHTVALVYSTLPLIIFRSFDLRFKMERTEDDDAEYELNVSIYGPDRLRVYYYEVNSGIEQSIHGADRMTAEFTEASLREWFIAMTKADRWKADLLVPVDGLNRAVDLIFSTLPNTLMIGGAETKLSLHLCYYGSQSPYDIVYTDPVQQEHFFTDGERLNVPMRDLTAELLLEDLKASFK